MGVLIHLCAGRLDADGVRERQLIEQGSGRLEDRGCEKFLVFRRQRRDESDLHRLFANPFQRARSLAESTILQSAFRTMPVEFTQNVGIFATERSEGRVYA